MSLLPRHLRVDLSGGVTGALVLSETFLGNAPIQIVSWLGKCGQGSTPLWPRGLCVGQYGHGFGALVLSKNCPGRDTLGIQIVLGLGKRCYIVRILGAQDKE